MSDKLKESISALMDDEAEESELRRVLAQSHDHLVAGSWQRYHQLRAALNHQEARWVGIDLRQAVNAELDKTTAVKQAEPGCETDAKLDLSEPVPGQDDSGRNSNGKYNDSESKNAEPGRNEEHSSKRWWNGLAIAASVAFAVVVAVQFSDPSQPAGPVLAGSKSLDPPAISADKTEPKQFSDEHEARLNEYIMRHTGHAALNTGKSIVPFARLTSFEPATDSPEPITDSPESVMDSLEPVMDSLEPEINSPERVMNSPERVMNSPERVMNSLEPEINSPERLINSPQPEMNSSE